MSLTHSPDDEYSRSTGRAVSGPRNSPLGVDREGAECFRTGTSRPFSTPMLTSDTSFLSDLHTCPETVLTTTVSPIVSIAVVQRGASEPALSDPEPHAVERRARTGNAVLRRIRLMAKMFSGIRARVGGAGLSVV